MRTIKGDLLELARSGNFDVIIHGCNCFHNFGAGIARQVLHKYPIAFEADKKTEYGVKEKLGHISWAKINYGPHHFTIVNAYTQYSCGTHERQVDYDALRECFRKVKAAFPGKKIGYPKIGAGLAGGDWETISKIIDEELEGEYHVYVEYCPKI